MNQQQAMGMLAGMLVCIAVGFLIVLLIQILFCLTLYRTQQKVAERNREMTPGLVWLDMIPIFSTFWGLYMVPRLSNSLRNEFDYRGWRTEGENFGRTVGMIWVWAGVVNFAIGIVEFAAGLGGADAVAQVLNLTGCPIGLTILVCWIIYWVQMYQYGKRLSDGGRGYARGSIEEDFDDNYRPGRDDDEEYRRRDENEPRRPRRVDGEHDNSDDRRRDEY